MKTFKYSGYKNNKLISGYIKGESLDIVLKYLSDIGIENTSVSEVISKTISIDNDIKIYKYSAYIDDSKKIMLEGLILSKNKEEAKNKLYNEFGLKNVYLEENDLNFIQNNLFYNNSQLINFFKELHSLLKWILLVFSFYIILKSFHFFDFIGIYTVLDINNYFFIVFIFILFIEFLLVEYFMYNKIWNNNQDNNIWIDINYISYIFIFLLGTTYFLTFISNILFIELPILIMIILYSFSNFIILNDTK